MKILVLSNGCFSKSDSNGRTLANLVSGFDREDLAQFFVYGTPDFEVCGRYYRVSDGDALRSFLKQRPFGGPVEAAEPQQGAGGGKKKIRKTPLSVLLREMAWLLGRWHSSALEQWIDAFAPDAILISLADNTFLPRLARKLAKRRGLPVYAYSTENYNFKNYNYLTRRPSVLYRLFYGWLNREYRRLEPYVKLGIFNSPLLAECYQQRYSYPCCCIFNRSEMEFLPKIQVSSQPRVSYLGNLGVGRHKPLAELANALGKILPGTKLEIYGKLTSGSEAEAALLSCENIRFHGFVAYEDVVRIMHESDLLIHAELDDPFWSKDLKYAFSTKIADCVCSGTPLLMYARGDLAGTDFVIRHRCAFVAENGEALEPALRRALTDEAARREVLAAARQTREQLFSQSGQLKRLLQSYQ